MLTLENSLAAGGGSWALPPTIQEGWIIPLSAATEGLSTLGDVGPEAWPAVSSLSSC